MLPASPISTDRARTGSGRRLLVLVLALAASAGAAAREVDLDALSHRLSIDPDTISLSGISSGAYMAQQLHVIHSTHVMGVGLIAGGPYRCAAGVYLPWSWFDPTGLYAATSVCSNTNPMWFYGGPPDETFSARETRREARRGAVDDPDGLRDDRVWLFSGGEDHTVPRAVVDVLDDYYLHFMPAGGIDYEKLEDAGHAMITLDHGNACDVSAPPFISDCDFDAAGRLLEHIYGALAPRAPAFDPDSLLAFDQTPFFDGDDPSVSLNRVGHVYVPARCREGARCRLHVAFHGCQQYQELIGDRFYTESGYDEWAESNAIVVLYPQTTAWAGSLGFGARQNPKGCWDWWGYSGEDYHRRDGKQAAAVAAMINTLLGQVLLETRVPAR